LNVAWYVAPEREKVRFADTRGGKKRVKEEEDFWTKTLKKIVGCGGLNKKKRFRWPQLENKNRGGTGRVAGQKGKRGQGATGPGREKRLT